MPVTPLQEVLQAGLPAVVAEIQNIDLPSTCCYDDVRITRCSLHSLPKLLLALLLGSETERTSFQFTYCFRFAPFSSLVVLVLGWRTPRALEHTTDHSREI